jgi:hypothetical protein
MIGFFLLSPVFPSALLACKSGMKAEINELDLN